MGFRICWFFFFFRVHRVNSEYWSSHPSPTDSKPSLGIKYIWYRTPRGRRRGGYDSADILNHDWVQMKVRLFGGDAENETFKRNNKKREPRTGVRWTHTCLISYINQSTRVAKTNFKGVSKSKKQDMNGSATYKNSKQSSKNRLELKHSAGASELRFHKNTWIPNTYTQASEWKSPHAQKTS